VVSPFAERGLGLVGGCCRWFCVVLARALNSETDIAFSISAQFAACFLFFKIMTASSVVIMNDCRIRNYEGLDFISLLLSISNEKVLQQLSV
jgi:hypothetical protein